jgi:hypothetical protein
MQKYREGSAHATPRAGGDCVEDFGLRAVELIPGQWRNAAHLVILQPAA